MKYILDRKKKLDSDKAKIKSKISSLEKEYNDINDQQEKLNTELNDKIYQVIEALLKKNGIEKEDDRDYITISQQLPELFDNISSVKLKEPEISSIQFIDLMYNDDNDEYELAIVDEDFGEQVGISFLSLESRYNILEYLLTKLNAEAFKNLNK